jgi:putative ABC transport system permease protein
MVSPKKSQEGEESLKDKLDGVKFPKMTTTSEMQSSDLISKDMIDQVCEKFKDDIFAVNVERVMGVVTATGNSNKTSINVVGASAGFFLTANLNIVAGNMFNENNIQDKSRVVLISDETVDEMFAGDMDKAVGSEIVLTINNQDIDFTIIGVYEFSSSNAMGGMGMMSTMINSYAYIPMATANDILHQENSYQYIEIIPKTGVNSEKLSNKIGEFFKQFYKNNSSYEVNVFTMSGMVSVFTNLLDTLTTAIAIIASIALLVGGIGVMNIMLVSVTERTREIGIRKALGAKNSSIREQFIVEAIIICLIGGIIGVALGIFLGSYLTSLLGYPAAPSIPGIIVALLFSMGIGIFFGYYPANKAAKMNPIDALRYE